MLDSDHKQREDYIIETAETLARSPYHGWSLNGKILNKTSLNGIESIMNFENKVWEFSFVTAAVSAEVTLVAVSLGLPELISSVAAVTSIGYAAFGSYFRTLAMNDYRSLVFANSFKIYHVK